MNDFITKLNEYLVTDGVTLAKSITIVLLGYLLIRLVIKILKYSVNKSKMKEKTLANFLISLFNVLLMIVLVVFALTLVGVSADSVVTIASVFSLGISLALQDTISSLANGIIIIMSKPFIEGEYVWINGEEGTVTSISMFHTVIVSAKGQMITIPNSSVTASNVINYSRLPTRRLDMNIPISYGTDIELVKRIVMQVVNKQNGIKEEPFPSIRLTGYEESNMMFTLKVWVSTDIYWDTVFDLNEKVIMALHENNIGFDYKKIEVNVIDEKGDK